MRGGMEASRLKAKHSPMQFALPFSKSGHTPQRSPTEIMIGRRAEIIADKQKATYAYTGPKRGAKPPRLDFGDWATVYSTYWFA